MTKGELIMVAYVYDLSAAELAQVEGGFEITKAVYLSSFQWGVGRGITA